MTERWRAEAKKVALEVRDAMHFQDEQGAVEAILELIERVQEETQDYMSALARKLLNDEATSARLNRVEVIDDTGRLLVRRSTKVRLSYQDEGRTLKVFLSGAGAASPSGER